MIVIMVCQDVRSSLPDHYTLISCLTKCCKLPPALNLAVGCKLCAAELSDMDVIPRDTGLSTKCRCGVSCLFLPHESEDKDSLLKWSLKNWMHSCQPTQCIQFWPSVDQQCREKRCCTGSSPAVQCPQECTSHPFTFIYVLPSRCF